MEFPAHHYILIIKGRQLTIQPDARRGRNMNLFYMVLFLWFIYLFLIRIVKVQTSLAFDWFMVLLLGAVLLYYFLTFIIRLIGGKQRAKYNIQKIIAAGMIEKDENIYVALQLQHKKSVTINFVNDRENAAAFVSALCRANGKISHLKNDI